MHFLLLLLLLIPVFYLLWLNGMLVINCKRALLYLDVRAGAPNSRKVTFSGCTGYTRRVLRLSCNCRYRFTLSCNVTKGTVRAEIHCKGANAPLLLGTEHPSQLLASGRCELVLFFEQADGTLQLTWEREENNAQSF